MAQGMTPAKKFALRAAMVSGSTVALIVGAQTLITVDAKSGRASQPAANSDTTATDTQQVWQPGQSDDHANSEVRVIRGPNGPILLFSREHEESEHDDDFFNQEQQFQSDQQSQLFNSQQSFSFPRTHSSR